MNRSLVAVTCAALLSACTVQQPVARYAISADNRAAIKGIHAKDVAVGHFVSADKIDPNCRGGMILTPPDGLSFAAYIQKALADELKVADSYGDLQPKVTLSGKVEELESSSTVGLTGGYWNIKLLVSSSNGQSVTVQHRSTFKAGFEGSEACRRVAAQFPAAVQDIIHELVTNSAFPALLQ
ncbi:MULTISPECIES: hypothetical protein [unclassified Caballeronia]|uniref:hypothetical protein n=1 Tax=unclassified Caballeronia TaxID=2646786 RepID=UPI0028674E5C|nr:MULTISPECIES: hypothetical protein [unclassified Caballeronia]MDR5755282.1 hypothetical protein [Caballeronia sp. LZ024]MDR5845413.1 hypothetical protein [Caballeronia sp. LZ031]